MKHRLETPFTQEEIDEMFACAQFDREFHVPVSDNAWGGKCTLYHGEDKEDFDTFIVKSHS